MTPAYDAELLRVALDRIVSAANAMLAHEQPEWMIHRLTHIIGECQSLRDALTAYENETKGANNGK